MDGLIAGRLVRFATRLLDELTAGRVDCLTNLLLAEWTDG